MRRARRDQSPIVRILSPLRDFLDTEASAATLIAGSAVAALIWANSPWGGSYEHLWDSRAAVSIAGHTLELDLRHWVNDGLMSIFFLVVGLEIKREVTDGHLASRRASLLPGAAALGGMLVPIALYLAIAGSTAPRGWAIPMATDIALAVGILAVAGDRIPASLRAFLLGLAIVDDIGAIVVIAVAYSASVRVGWILLAGLGAVAAVVCKRAGVYATPVYVVIGCFIWFSLHEGNIHPTLAGVAMGLLAPTTPRLQPELIDVEALADVSDVGAARETTELARGSVSVVEWLQHVLHPWASFAIVPLFALANSGIRISVDGIADAARSPITWGVFVGLVAGKPLGVVLATRTTIRLGLADQPPDAAPRQVLGIGAAAGIGFTVALFITELAFSDPDDRSNATLGILLASVVAAAASSAVLRTAERAP